MKYPTNQVHLISKCGAAHEAFCNSTRTINYVYGSVPGRVFFYFRAGTVSCPCCIFGATAAEWKKKRGCGRIRAGRGRNWKESRGLEGVFFPLVHSWVCQAIPMWRGQAAKYSNAYAIAGISSRIYIWQSFRWGKKIAQLSWEVCSRTICFSGAARRWWTRACGYVKHLVLLKPAAH